ncbi:MAG TPA: response regulator transcription factor [Actinomycetota bacterium]|nr:response regulator transcription factor [Actinomycetota bacterium]
MADSRTIRVLIVDDVDHLRFALSAILELDPELEVAGEAVDGFDALEKASDLQPDLILLDLAMPNLDGLQAIPRLLERAPDSRILVLSGFGKSALEEQAMEAGASGYIEKGGDPAAIAEALKNAHRADR